VGKKKFKPPDKNERREIEKAYDRQYSKARREQLSVKGKKKKGPKPELVTDLRPELLLDTMTKRKAKKLLGPEWLDVVGERSIYNVFSCEFGFAEEVICCMLFKDGTAEVGVGESMRGYHRVYNGNSHSTAFKAFLKEIANHV